MYEANAAGITRNLAGVLAAAIVAAGALVFDRVHLESAPEGIVEIGALTLVEPATELAVLPEVVVTGKKA